jgi:uncharacterized membrane protein
MEKARSVVQCRPRWFAKYHRFGPFGTQNAVRCPRGLRPNPKTEPTAVSSQPAVAATAKKNVEMIAQLEQQVLAQRSTTERLGAAVAGFVGSLYSMVAHGLFLAIWIGWNAEGVPAVRRFDPYPFPFLSLIVGIEFIFLTTFVLMNQKHQMRRAEQWSHLHLQLSMLTEQEVTKNMQILHTICQELGVDKPSRDQEVSELSQNTAIAALAEEIEKARDSDARE